MVLAPTSHLSMISVNWLFLPSHSIWSSCLSSCHVSSCSAYFWSSLSRLPLTDLVASLALVSIWFLCALSPETHVGSLREKGTEFRNDSAACVSSCLIPISRECLADTSNSASSKYNLSIALHLDLLFLLLFPSSVRKLTEAWTIHSSCLTSFLYAYNMALQRVTCACLFFTTAVSILLFSPRVL